MKKIWIILFIFMAFNACKTPLFIEDQPIYYDYELYPMGYPYYMHIPHSLRYNYYHYNHVIRIHHR